MDKRFVIFDMDGTLVDSMVYWENLATEFLESKGVQTISPDILERIKPMTMTKSAALFIQEYDLPGTAESVAAEMNAMMDEHYRKDIPLKPGVQTALTIAGSDCSGGAGIQADIKTMTANGVYAMSAITALTAQNTTGVSDILEVPPAFLANQLDAIFTDIYPDAVKIGMVSSAPLIEVIAEKLRQYGAKNIVVDPVMGATSGAKLLKDEALQALTQQLLSLAKVCTPNIPEAEILSGMRITSAEDMVAAAKIISERYGCAVLCKGGHAINDANDLLWKDGEVYWFHGKRIDNPNTHGTGCTLSSAIASNLAKGQPLHQAVENAKAYISGALAAMLDLGKGSGPLNHAFSLKYPE